MPKETGGNEHFALWQDQAGISNRGLAKMITDAADQAGLRLGTNATQVALWRAGRQPRGHTAVLIAAVLSTLCNRQLSLSDLGFTAVVADFNDPSPRAHGAHARLAHAGQLAQGRLAMDLNRRNLIKAGLTAGASVAAAMDWLLPDWMSAAHADSDGVGSVGSSDASTLWKEARALLARDNKEGGRAVCPQALVLLNQKAVPLLSGCFASTAAENQVKSAVAYAGHLAAWCEMDKGDLVSAQKLMTTALDLAKEARDPIVAAGILTDMAHAEHLAGDPDHGVLCARAAQSPGPGRLPAAILARAAAMEARNHARKGDLQGSREAIGRAESYLENADRSVTEPHPLDFFFTYDQLHHELHVAYRDLAIAKVANPDTVLEHERLIGPAKHMGRRAAMVDADAAIAHLLAGDFGSGMHRADSAIKNAAPLGNGSGRVLGALQRIRPHLTPYTPANADARDLDARLRAAAPWALAV